MDTVTYALSKKYADNAIFKELSSISAITFNNEYESFSDLPTIGSQGVVYLIPITAEDGVKYCEQYIFINGQYNLIGATQAYTDAKTYIDISIQQAIIDSWEVNI